MSISPRDFWLRDSFVRRLVSTLAFFVACGILTPATATASGTLSDCTIAAPRLGGVSYYEFWLLDGSRFSCPGFSLSNWSAVARVKRNGSLVKEVNAGANQIYLTGLASGTDYTVSIVVTDETGASKEGEALSVRTAGVVDSTPPTIGDASPLQPTTGLAGASFTAQFLVTDAVGVLEVDVELVDKTGSNVVANAKASRVAGTAQNGTWSVRLASPSSAQPNDFFNARVKARDTSGNAGSSWVGVGTYTVVEPQAAPIRVGIYLISGRTSEIYGRADGVADSQQQIQWVTCVESLSESMLYPKRDQIRYTYTVTGPSGQVASGSWDPNAYVDSQSSCTSNGGSGNMYTVAYNLTGLAPGTAYQFSVNGYTRSSTFSGSATFKTLAGTSSNPGGESSRPESSTTVTPETSTSPTGSRGSSSGDSSGQTGRDTSVATSPSSSSSSSSGSPATPTIGRVETAVVQPVVTTETTTASSSPATTSNNTGASGQTSSSIAPIPTVSPRPVSETVLEGQDEDARGTLTVRRTDNGRYRLSVATNLDSEDLVIRATKKGAKTILFQVTLNEDGRAVIITSRNLAGYRLVLLFGEDSLDSVRAS